MIVASIVGMVIPFAAKSGVVYRIHADRGEWRDCNGQWLSKSEYPLLFSLLKTNCGRTRNHFQLPVIEADA